MLLITATSQNRFQEPDKVEAHRDGLAVLSMAWFKVTQKTSEAHVQVCL